MSTFAATCQFNTVCESLENIFKLKGPNKKTEELLKLLQNCRELGDKSKNKNKDTDISLYPILRLLLPQLERERGPHGLKEKSLTSLYNRIFCLGKETLNSRNQSKYRADYTGEDLADRVYNAVRNQLQSDKSSLSVKKINEFLDSISNKNESNKKIDTTFLTIAKKLSAFEFKWLTRIVLKDLKLGIGEKKILKAFHPNAEKLFDVTSNLREICERLSVESSVEKPRIRTFFHVKPMLLERCKIEDIGKLFRDQSSQYFVQIKYDGERSQIHMKDGKFKYFTRMGHDITKNTAYGETSDSEGFLSKNIARLLKIDCYSLILDGEIMGWHKEKKRFGSKGMTYDVKKLTTNSAYQPCFIAFDIILYNDELLVDLPYSERLQKLEKLFEDKEGVMIKGKTSRVSNSEQIVEFFNESLDKKEEGIVVKECDMLYKPNVRAGSGCYKIKAEYSDGLIQDMDLIILGAYYGDGRAAGKLNSFLMGVSEPSVKEADKPAKFQSVVSVSSGLNYEQLKELQKQFQLKGQLKCPETVVGPRKPKVSTMQAQISKTDGIGSRRQPINTECQVQVSDVLKHPVESQDQSRDSAALKITEKPRIISAITIASKKQEDIPDNSANSSLHSPRESDLDDDMDSNASTQEQDRENKSQGDKESKLACNNCKEFRKQTRQLQRQLVDLEIENRKLRKLNANMGEKVVNYFEEVRSTIHNVSKNSAQELERKILSGEDLPVGERNEAMQKKNPPDVWINPKDSVILQLRATEIIRSSFYPSGYSLRFPRVLAVRDDKPWYSVCSSSEFLSFVKDTGFVQKLTKRHATNLDGENIQYKKLPRQSAPSKKKIDERFLGIQRFDIVRISRLLEGKEICVLNGNEEMPINEIQKILFAHAAEVVQNPGTKTFCVIVGNPAKTKTNNAMQNPQHDFVTLSWLKRVTENKNWYKLEDFYPCELLSAQFSTKNRIQEMYDKFDDNFADDAGEHSFKCTVKKTEIEVENQNFSIADFEEMDKDLFEKGSSPFSVFRSIVGYFHNPEDNEKFTFRFMAGTISTNINEHVTHIFIEEDSPSIIEYFAGYVTDRQPQIKIMKIKWIADCFKKRTLLEGDNYIVNVNNFT